MPARQKPVGGLLPIPVYGTYAITTPKPMFQVVWTIEHGDNVYLVDYDQTLNACDKNDEFASNLDWKNAHGNHKILFVCDTIVSYL